MFLLYLCNMFVSSINIRWIPREVLKTSTTGLGFQHLPWDPENVNARKNIFDPYIHFHPYYHDDLKFSDRQVWEGP